MLRLNRYMSRLVRQAPWGAAWGMVEQIQVQAGQESTLADGGKMLQGGLGAAAQVRQSVCECGVDCTILSWTWGGWLHLCKILLCSE